MKKSTNMFKRIFALILVVLMSIESLGAVVSDNDGSAFITKAEFDSLKNNFQSQIDQYNTSIDSKIDGAIASYLAGISLKKKKEVENLVWNYNEIQFMKDFYLYGKTKKFDSKMTYVLTDTGYFKPNWQNGYTAWRQPYFQLVFPITRSHGGFVVSLFFYLRASDGNNGKNWVQCDNGTLNGPLVISCESDRDDMVLTQQNLDWKVGKNEGLPYYIYWDNVHFDRKYAGVQSDYPYRTTNGGGSWNQEGYINRFQPSRPMPNVRKPFIEKPITNPLNNIGEFWFETAYQNWNYNNIWLRWPIYFGTHNTAITTKWYTNKKLHDTDEFGKTNLNDCNFSNNFFINTTKWTCHVDEENEMRMNANLENLMLGEPNTTVANIRRISQTNYVENTFTENTQYDELRAYTFDMKTAYVGTALNWTYDSNPGMVEYTGSNISAVTLNIPTVERYDFNKISSGKFKYNGNNLKFGDGLPLLLNTADKGDVTIEFDWTVNRIYENKPNNTDYEDIDVSIKKTNFLDAGAEYWTAYINDDENTGVTLNRYRLVPNNNTHHAKIKIEDVKNNDSMWLNIAPNNALPGLYVSISNLKTTFDIE